VIKKQIKTDNYKTYYTFYFKFIFISFTLYFYFILGLISKKFTEEKNSENR